MQIYAKKPCAKVIYLLFSFLVYIILEKNLLKRRLCVAFFLDFKINFILYIKG